MVLFSEAILKSEVIFHILSVFTITATSFDLDKSRGHLINMQLRYNYFTPISQKVVMHN